MGRPRQPGNDKDFDQILSELRDEGVDEDLIERVRRQGTSLQSSMRARQEMTRAMGGGVEDAGRYEEAIKTSLRSAQAIKSTSAMGGSLEQSIIAYEEARERGETNVSNYVDQITNNLSTFADEVGMDEREVDDLMQNVFTEPEAIRDAAKEALEKHHEAILMGFAEQTEKLVEGASEGFMKTLEDWAGKLNKAMSESDVAEMNAAELIKEINRRGGPTPDLQQRIGVEGKAAATEGREENYEEILREHLEGLKSREAEAFKNVLPESHFARYGTEGNYEQLTLTEIEQRKKEEVLGAESPYDALENLRTQAMSEETDRESVKQNQQIQAQVAQAQAQGGDINALLGIYAPYAARRAFQAGGGGQQSLGQRVKGLLGRGGPPPPVGPGGGGAGGAGAGGAGGPGGGGLGGLGGLLGGGAGGGAAGIGIHAIPAIANTALNFGTPNPGTAVQSAGSTLGNLVNPISAGGAGFALGGPVGAAIGFGIGTAAQSITAPLTSYMGRQARISEQFGPQITSEGEVEGRRVLPSFGGLTEALGGRERSDAERLMGQQTLTKLSHWTVGGEEIDNLTSALGNLGNTASETADLLDTGADMMEKYSLNAEEAAQYANLARFSEYGGLAPATYAERRARLAEEGVEVSKQQDIAQASEQVLGGIVGHEGATQLAQDITQGFANIEDKEAQQFALESGAPEALVQTRGNILRDPNAYMGYMTPQGREFALHGQAIDPTTGKATEGAKAVAGQAEDEMIKQAMRPILSLNGVAPGEPLPSDAKIPQHILPVVHATWVASGGDPNLQAPQIVQRYNQIVSGSSNTELMMEGENQRAEDFAKVAEDAGAGGETAYGAYRGGEDVGFMTKLASATEDILGSAPGGALVDWITGGATEGEGLIAEGSSLSNWMQSHGVVTSDKAKPLRDAADETFGAASGLGQLASLAGSEGEHFDPSTLRLTGLSETLGDVAGRAEGGWTSFLSGDDEAAQEQLKAIESGEQTYDIKDAEGEWQTVTQEQLGMMQAGQGLDVGEEGDISINEAGQQMLDSGALESRGRIEVSETEYLKQILNFEDVTQRETGAGSTSRAAHNYDAAQGGRPSGGPLK